MKEPRFKVEVPGPPGCWEYVEDRYFLGWGYKRGRFCWGHFLKREIVFIQDRNETGLCRSCMGFVREARKRRKRRRAARASGPSNAARGKETRRRIVELLKQNGGAMFQVDIAAALGITPDAVRYHMTRGLAGWVERGVGPRGKTKWELAA